MLPSGPWWTHRVISLNHEMKDPVHLYYCDMDCVKLLFNHPLFADKIEFSLYELFTFAVHDVQVYTEWMSSDNAWELQVSSKQNHCYFCKLIIWWRKKFPLVARYVVSSYHQIKPTSPIYVEEKSHILYYWALQTTRCMWGTRLPHMDFFFLHCYWFLSFSTSLLESAKFLRRVSSITA